MIAYRVSALIAATFACTAAANAGDGSHRHLTASGCAASSTTDSATIKAQGRAANRGAQAPEQRKPACRAGMMLMAVDPCGGKPRLPLQ
tara:strand:- start:1435 stop:1701 length:267 start_codon:yes stop_codon:yes gene_type:complete